MQNGARFTRRAIYRYNPVEGPLFLSALLFEFCINIPLRHLHILKKFNYLAPISYFGRLIDIGVF